MSGDGTRNRIVEAAGPIFAEKGFQAATVREICQAAGVNLASVNYHFGDKEKLYLEVLRCAHAPGFLTSSDQLTGVSAVDRFRSFVELFVARLMTYDKAHWKMCLLRQEVINPTHYGVPLIREYFGKRFQVLLDILDEIVPADMPLHKRRKIALSIIGQCVHYNVAHEVINLLVPEEERSQHFTQDQICDHIVHMSLAALGIEPPIGDKQKVEKLRKAFK